jgi:dihydroorotate dehydrogenase (NAD+) catalytic subunit
MKSSASKTPDMRVSIGSLQLANPVMVASGTFGFGEEYAELIDIDALGAIVTKGTSLEPRKGNPAPRTAETPAGMLNSVGLENPGIDVFISDKLPWLGKKKPAVIVNIIGSTIDDYAKISARLNAEVGVDALEVNISCPNVSAGGIAFGSNAQAAAEVSRVVRQQTDKPILVKLTPNVTDIAEIAARVAETGIDGLTLINTLKGLALDYRTGKPLLGNGIGGLSGPAIRPVAVRAVFEVCQAVDIPVVGCGGIVNWPDAVEFFRAGACAIQVGSATFRNPGAALEILDGLKEYMTQTGCTSVGDLVGTVQMGD